MIINVFQSNLKSFSFENQIEYFYSKYASNYASEQEPVQTILNEYERVINEFKDILLIDPPKGKEADIREVNQLFEQFEALLGKEINRKIKFFLFPLCRIY